MRSWAMNIALKYGRTGRSLQILPSRTTTSVTKATEGENGGKIASTAECEFSSAKPFSDIPGNKGVLAGLKLIMAFIPVFGKHTKEPLRIREVFMDRYKRFGKLNRLDVLAGKKFVFVYDPDDIRRVFLHEGKQPCREILDAIKHYRLAQPDLYKTGGILTENGDDWYNTRSKVQGPMLRPNIVETYIPSMVTVSDDFLQRMRKLRNQKGEIPGLLQEFYKWALESLGLVTFNHRLGCLEDHLSPNSEGQKFIRALMHGIEGLSDMEGRPKVYKYFPTAAYRKAARAQDFIRTVAVKYTNKTKELMEQHPHDDDIGGILGVLLREQDLDQRDLITFLTDLLLAGIDSTAHTVGFALYLLARNPEAQAKAYEEIKRLVPSKTSEITARELKETPYLRAVLKETMRMMATFDAVFRELDHDIVLSGYHIPAGTTLGLLTSTASRLPEYYEEPEKFKPERWLDPDKPHPFSSLPFGFGPRMCIGRRIAMQEIHLLMMRLILNYRVEYHYEDFRPYRRLTSMPDKPLNFTFIDRTE